MFDFIRTYIHNFFKLYPRMYEGLRDHSYVPILHYDVTYTPGHFFQTICDANPDSRAQYHVRQLIWYKETSGSYHEFILAELSDSSALVVERRPSWGSEPKFVMSTSLPSPSNSTILARDTVYSMSKSSSALTARLASCPAEPVGHYNFNYFPLLEFARLLAVISQQNPHYVINKTMCYWFASSIVGIARKEFGGDTIDPTTPFLAGSWKLYKYKVNVKELEAIREIYAKDRAAHPEPIGPREAQWRRELNETKANAEQELNKTKANAEQELNKTKANAEQELNKTKANAEQELNKTKANAEHWKEMAEKKAKETEEKVKETAEKQKQIEELQRALEKANRRVGQ